MNVNKSILRKFIREAINELEQQAVPPGKWAANTGEPASEEDLERLGEKEFTEDTSIEESDENYDW